jgi:hypothetical protein
MLGQRVGILMIIVLPLAFIGCTKNQPPAVSAQVAAVPAGPAGPATVPTETPAVNLTILHRANTKHGEAHQLVGPGTVIVWEYDQPGYYVSFINGTPCGTQYDFVLNPAPTGSHEGYITSCTVTANQPGTSFPYHMVKGTPPPPTKERKHGDKSSGHCQGCAVDE